MLFSTLTRDSFKTTMRMLAHATGLCTQLSVELLGIGVIKHEKRTEFVVERQTTKDGIHVKPIADPMLRGPFHYFSYRSVFCHVAASVGAGRRERGNVMAAADQR